MTDITRILVVDDTEAGRFVKVQILRRAGYAVEEASTGADALAIVDREPPDLLVLDVNLPDISGLEVTRRVRAAYPGAPALQILQISNTAVRPADQVLGLEQGADVYLTEPVDADVLIATVQSLLRVRRAEAALAVALESERRAREIAEAANRAKDDFLATLSHELRTPLNAIMGWLWQLRHSQLSDVVRERALDSLERNARMQAQLINDLLDVSRISKGKLTLDLQWVDLREVALTVCENTRALAEQKEVTVNVQLTPAVVLGDPGRLQQILTNLLTNAVQYTPASGQIWVTLEAARRDAVLTVRDTGSGIEPVLLPYIFDPFRQGEGALSRRHGGLGLGLAVVRQLVDLHGGTITASSEGLGNGATFKISLPREAHVTDAIDAGPVLADVRALVLANEPAAGSLKATLESAGADVSLEASPGETPTLVVQQRLGPPRFQLVSWGSDAWVDLPDGPPAAMVREIARALTGARAS